MIFHPGYDHFNKFDKNQINPSGVRNQNSYYTLNGTIPLDGFAVVLPVGGVAVLSITAIPTMDEALTGNPPSLPSVIPLRSVEITQASETTDANSRARSTIKLPHLQAKRHHEMVPKKYKIK